MGDSIVRKTDTILSKGKDVVVCLPGARIEHVIERIEEDHGKRTWRVHTGTHRDEQRRQGRNNSNSGEVQEPTEEEEASTGLDRYSYQEFDQCSTDTGIRSRWQSTGW